MRTTLLCLFIAGLALLLGLKQSARIAWLESRIENAKPQHVTKASTARALESSKGYRSKAHARNPDVTAAQVYQRVLDLVKPVKGGNMMGIDAALQHREAMEEILQLDLKGIRGLMELVSQSKELKKDPADAAHRVDTLHDRHGRRRSTGGIHPPDGGQQLEPLVLPQ